MIPQLPDVVSGFNHPSLAQQPGYAEFRRALAHMVDGTTAPLGRFLADVRDAAISSLFGAMCPTCSETCFPFRGNRRGQAFVGTYECPSCATEFRFKTALDRVTWSDAPQLPRDGDGSRRAGAGCAGQATTDCSQN